MTKRSHKLTDSQRGSGTDAEWNSEEIPSTPRLETKNSGEFSTISAGEGTNRTNEFLKIPSNSRLDTRVGHKAKPVAGVQLRRGSTILYRTGSKLRVGQRSQLRKELSHDGPRSKKQGRTSVPTEPVTTQKILNLTSPNGCCKRLNTRERTLVNDREERRKKNLPPKQKIHR